MDAFTQMMIDATKSLSVDLTKLRSAGEGEVTHRQRVECMAAYLKFFFYDWLSTKALMPDFAASMIIEIFENRVNWSMVAECILQVPENN